ncbi:MAG: twin-arginine translocation signal domain-containing protein [Faecalibacterium sp.]|nr:twin-arginine translocation signal domain-containing protein [Faecalibacterium sp.]
MSVKISRRNFLKCAGAATLAVAASGVLTSCGKPEDIVMQDVTVYFVYQTVRQNTTATVSVPKNADVLSTALIKPEQLPEGFKIAKQGEVPITVVDGVATAEVEIVVGTPTKVVEVRFFEEDGSQLPETTTVEVEATAQVVNVADIKIPEKYKSHYDTVNGQPAIGTDRDGKLYTVVILRAKEISFTIQYVLDKTTVVLSDTHIALSTIKSVNQKDLNAQQVNKLKNDGYEPDGDGIVGDDDVITVPVKKIMGDVTVTYKNKYNFKVETKSEPLQLWIKDTKVTGETLRKQAPLSTVNSWIYTIDEGTFDVIWTGNSGVVNATVSSRI